MTSEPSQSELLRPLFDQVPVGIVAVLADGRIPLVNRWIREFFAPFDVDERTGHVEVDWSRIAHVDGRPIIPGTLPLERSIAHGRAIFAEEYLWHGPHGDRTISLDATPIVDESGEIIVYAMTVVDLTQTRRFLDQLGEIQRELDSHVHELERVHRLIERLSTRSDLDELLKDTAEVVAELDGAEIVGIFLKEDGELRLAANAGMTEEQVRLVEGVRQADLYTSQRAMLGLPTMLVDVQQESGLSEAYREAIDALGGVSVYSLPLSAEGQVLGSVVSVFKSVRSPSPQQKQLVETCGRVVAQLIVNAKMRAKDRDLAVALQRSMMQQRLPEVPWGELASFYRAGSAGMQVGGDWFNGTVLEDGRLSLAIGDVVGHGLDAVMMMGRMRSAVRAYAVLEDDRRAPGPLQLAKLLDRWSTATGGGEASTACFAQLEPGGRCVLASAGQPPPLVVAEVPGPFSARFAYEESPGAPLGLYSDANGAHEVLMDLAPGATLLMYTDGLVERRGEEITAGLERLRMAAASMIGATPEGGLQDACARIAQQCAPESSTEDDVAILAFRMHRARR